MILICFGTRPEWLKIKPVVDKINNKIPYRLVCTGQHDSLLDPSIQSYNVEYLNIKNQKNRLDDIVISILDNAEKLFNNILYVMVQGDTTSAFAVALSAFHRKIPIIHLEAGLRSFDINNPYPEEFNRISISNIASIHLCPTENNKYNLRHVSGEKYVIGNTILDSIRDIQPSIENFILVTMHRRENIELIDEWFNAIENLAYKNPNLKFILPLHLNPQIQKYKHIFNKVSIMNPVSHQDLIKILSKCAMVITDSGGIQEESAFLKKKCIVCRKTTERTEGEFIFSELCPHPSLLETIFKGIKIELVNHKCPYGDGYACDKVLNIFERLYAK